MENKKIEYEEVYGVTPSLLLLLKQGRNPVQLIIIFYLFLFKPKP